MSDDKKGAVVWFTNRLGHPAGRALAKGLWKSDWVRRMARENPEMMRLASEGLVAVTSLLELGGNNPIARFANFVSETLATENLELLEQFEKDPENPELAKKVNEKIESTIDKAEKEVFLVLEHVHRDKSCVAVAQYLADTTPPARTGKDGKVFSNPSSARLVTTTLSSAINAGKPLCGICYPAVSVRKPEEKYEKAKEIVPGRNFLEYVMRLKADDEEKYNDFWKTYLYRLSLPDGPLLSAKFQEAFNGKHSYEAFCFVVTLPHRDPDPDKKWEEWHHALDALLGKVTPHDSLKKSIEGFIAEEKRQTEEMFLALFAWIKKANEARAVKIDEKKAVIKNLDEEWAARKASRKTGKTARKIVFLSLLVILASWYAIQRAESADARSENLEQKETSHVR